MCDEIRAQPDSQISTPSTSNQEEKEVLNTIINTLLAYEILLLLFLLNSLSVWLTACFLHLITWSETPPSVGVSHMWKTFPLHRLLDPRPTTLTLYILIGFDKESQR